MSLPLESPVDAIYGELRARLEAAGQPIGGNGRLIAAQAIALDCTIVTGNGREFDRILEFPAQELAEDIGGSHSPALAPATSGPFDPAPSALWMTHR